MFRSWYMAAGRLQDGWRRKLLRRRHQPRGVLQKIAQTYEMKGTRMTYVDVAAGACISSVLAGWLEIAPLPLTAFSAASRCATSSLYFRSFSISRSNGSSLDSKQDPQHPRGPPQHCFVELSPPGPVRVSTRCTYVNWGLARTGPAPSLERLDTADAWMPGSHSSVEHEIKNADRKWNDDIQQHPSPAAPASSAIVPVTLSFSRLQV